MTNMKRIAAASVVVVALAGVTLGASVPAQARNGGAIAAGVVGGLALGAIAGSAAANSGGYGYGGGYGYQGYAAPAYAAPAYGGGCYITRQATYDAYGNFAGNRRVRVCE